MATGGLTTMAEDRRELRSWRERRRTTPLSVPAGNVSEETTSSANTAKPQTHDSLRVSLRTETSANPRSLSANPPEIVKDAAYWESRCWANDCENEPAEQQGERFRGRYCAPCQVLVAADAERIANELGVAV